MANKFRLESIRVDADIVRKFTGIAIDIGSSAVKIVYRTESNWEQVVTNESIERGSLQLLTCGRLDLNGALDIVKKDIYLTRVDGKETSVVAIGVGSPQFVEIIQKALDVKCNIIFEGDCMFKGLHTMLAKCCTADVIYPKLVQAEQDTWEQKNKQILQMKKFIAEQMKTKIERSESDLPPCQEGLPVDEKRTLLDILGGKDELYPFVLAFLGSGYGIMTVGADHSAKKLSGTLNRGGRFFLGVGSMVTECKSYDELMDLAEKGDNANVDDTKNSIARKKKPGSDDDDPYSKNLQVDPDDDMLVFSFGQAVFEDRSKFQREDLARAWLLAHIQQICQSAYSDARTAGIKYILVAGNFSNREIARKLMTEEFTNARLDHVQTYGTADAEPELVFLKHGGILGAFGAMLKDIEMQQPTDPEKGQ